MPVVPTWIGSATDVRNGATATAALQHINDAEYWHAEYGIPLVNESRWLQAQQFELDGWRAHWTDHTSDRNEQHAKLFDNYSILPKQLGHVIEFGCGPFTQLQTIAKNRQCDSITLLDPLLREYMKLDNCTYKSGTLLGHVPQLLPMPAEECSESNRYNAAICINVLEHVRDARCVLKNICDCLSPNGVLIFGERHYNGFDPTKIYDVGHPIRVSKSLLQEFSQSFDILQFSTANNADIFNQHYYFIGRIRS